MITVTSVKPLTNYYLELGFSNNEIRCFDVKPYLEKGIFTELKDESYFKQVALQLGSITWKNGQDFSPETLYIKSVAV
ncbi:MAG: DUF2442 domain-containing protein [Bacteroidetes bacterium]|nr:DUF2442 domain-containing protein [Bacteroidota bacterium]